MGMILVDLLARSYAYFVVRLVFVQQQDTLLGNSILVYGYLGPYCCPNQHSRSLP